MELHKISPRDQNIIEHLVSLWQLSSPITSEHLRAIVEMLARFSSEPSYQEIGIQKIAEYLTSSMSVHLLSLLAIFLQKAEEEKMRPERIAKVLNRVLSPLLAVLSRLPEDIHTQSLDDLSVLSNITVGLQELSQTNSAVEAQSWLRDLPKMYYGQLQENLVATNISLEPQSMYMIGGQSPQTVHLSPDGQFSFAEVIKLSGSNVGYTYPLTSNVHTKAS